MGLRWTDRPRFPPTYNSHLLGCPVGPWVCRPNLKPSKQDDDHRRAMEQFDREARR